MLALHYTPWARLVVGVYAVELVSVYLTDV